jgi:LacI family transcriptional regulator
MKLLDLAERPTAIFAANDQMAYGVLAAGRTLQIKLPEELAVIGFDDTALALHMVPALTTVRQPFQEMGKSAAELLLTLISIPKSINGGWYDPISHLVRAHAQLEPQRLVHVKLPTELVIRASCGSGAVLPVPDIQIQVQ